MAVELTQQMIDSAKETEKLYGVPTSITLGQIMLESGGSYSGGLSGLAKQFNNLFGITAGSSWKGETVYMTNKNGTDGQVYRVYDSIEESILDHGALLANDHYTKYTQYADNIKAYASALQTAGYATDTEYSTKLINVIESNNLTQYDLGTNITTGNNGSATHGGGSSNGTPSSEQDETEDIDTRWWGDIVVIILAVILAVIGIIFFVLAFNGGSASTLASNVANKATGGALKKAKKLMK